MAPPSQNMPLMGNLTVIDEVHNDFPNFFIAENQELKKSVYFDSFIHPVHTGRVVQYNTFYWQ